MIPPSAISIRCCKISMLKSTPKISLATITCLTSHHQLNNRQPPPLPPLAYHQTCSNRTLITRDSSRTGSILGTFPFSTPQTRHLGERKPPRLIHYYENIASFCFHCRIIGKLDPLGNFHGGESHNYQNEHHATTPEIGNFLLASSPPF